MIKISYNSNGWIASENGKQATSTFDEGEHEAVQRLQFMFNKPKSDSKGLFKGRDKKQKIVESVDTHELESD